MAAQVYDIEIDQGATWEQNVAWKNPDGSAVDLTGYTARMKISTVHEADEALVSLTDQDGITITAATGELDIEISDERTAALPAGVLVYDLDLVTPAGKPIRLMKGKATVFPGVSHR